MAGRHSYRLAPASDIRLSERVRRFEKKTGEKYESEKVRSKCSVCCGVFSRRVKAFLYSRWMGLVLGPVYGVLIYLYVTHLFLAGAPFTRSNDVISGDNSNHSQNPCASGGFKFNPNKQGLADKVTGDKKKTGSPRVYASDPEFTPIMSKMTSHYIGAGIGGTIGGGLLLVSPFNKRTRCSMVLMIPSLLTKRGRGFMLTFVTSLVLGGPVNIMQYNLQELVRSFTCMYCQVKGVVERFHEDIKDLMNQFIDVMRDVENVMKDTKQTLSRLLDSAVGDQRKKIQSAYNDIQRQANKVEEAGSVLQGIANAPSTATSWVCNGIASLWGGKCKVPNIVKLPKIKLPELGISDKLKEIMSQLYPDIDLMSIDLEGMKGQINSSSITEIREKMRRIFNEVMNLIKLIGRWWSKIFYISILFLVADAINYQRNYYIDDDFDNNMIDNNLKKIWREDGKKKLTPMRNWELKKRFQISTSLKLTQEEINRMFRQSYPTLIGLILIGAILTADFVFINVLETFEENAKFAISFPGMEKGVSFSSFLAEGDATVNILKVQAFDIRTDECLPKGLRTDPSTIGIIFAVMMVCLLSCIIDAYFSRLRATILNIFYPERAKQRAKYLYKKIQIGRRSRFHQLHLILTRQLDQRKRSEEIIIINTDTCRRIVCMNPNVSCLGCDMKKTTDMTPFRLNYNGETIDVDICVDCNKKPKK